MVDRFAIAKTLRKIGALLALQGAPSFRAQAYGKGAAALEAAEDFERLLAHKRLTDLPGIGQGLSSLIGEIAATGEAAMLRELEAELPPGAFELSAILGLEPMKKLHAALGITSVAALEAACIAGQVRGVRGFGEKTETRLLEKIRAQRARGAELLLQDAKAVAAELRDYLREAHPEREVHVVGAIRRGLELVDRIELLADAGGDGTAMAASLARFPKVVRAAGPESPDDPALRAWLNESGNDAESGIAVSLWLVSDDAREGIATLAHTGPSEHVEAVLARVPPSEVEALRREEDVYAAAGLAPTPPELRDDPTMLFAAGASAPRLLDATDVQGLVHCHTTWSDGRHSVAEMAQAAAARGLRYITFTDHSQAAGYANGLDVERMQRQWDEIDRVQQTTSVRLLKGIESDILADGALDYPDDVLARLDVVIASIHARHAQSAEDMTRRVLAMMRHPAKKIWGHPLGRLLQRRAPIDCDVDLLLRTAAETGTILELNGDPHRMDLPVELARKARALGVKFVASVDAHATTQLGYLDNAVTLARRAALGPEHVLNTRDAAAFAAAVRPFA